jgi:tetratricopeptide (TPR) repeat protein
MSNSTGERVRALRTTRGIGQTELAAAIGVSKSYLSHIEAGRRPMSPALQHQVAEALGVEVEQLESGTPADTNEELRLKLAFAELSLRNGERDVAAREFTEVRDRARVLPLERFLDEASWGLARAEEAAGRLEEAILVYEELLARPRLSPAVSRSGVVVRLVMAYSECGDLGRAVDLGEQALAELDQVDPPEDVSAQVELISTVAGCYLERGDLTRAQLLIERALGQAGDDGAPRARAAAAWNAAVIAQARHDAVGARLHADRALTLYSEIDNARGVALLRVVSAALHLRQEHPDAGAALLDLSSAIGDLQDVGTRLDLGYARTEQARALLVSGKLEEANEAGRQALTELSTVDWVLTGETMLVLGNVALAQQDSDTALAYFEQAATALAHSAGSRQAGVAWRQLGEAYAELGRAEEAIAALRRASDLAGATYNPLRPSLAATGDLVAR